MSYRMKICYVVYSNDGRQAIGMYDRLSAALYYASKGNQIVTLKGPYYGEGYHASVRRVLDNKKFRYLEELEVNKI